MEKKTYLHPTLYIVQLQHTHFICGSGNGRGGGVHDDDPQNPSAAMTQEYKSNSIWDEVW